MVWRLAWIDRVGSGHSGAGCAKVSTVFTRFKAMLAAALLVSAFCSFPLFAADGPAIPPGQEDLLLEMLGKGKTLPGGCTLDNGQVDYTVVEATYKCRLGEVVVELAHFSEAGDTDLQTEQFAIAILEGSAPASLRESLSAMILAREGDFDWVDPAGDQDDSGAEDFEQ